MKLTESDAGISDLDSIPIEINLLHWSGQLPVFLTIFAIVYDGDNLALTEAGQYLV